jgi:DNA-binding transcriptional LysR family regulator
MTVEDLKGHDLLMFSGGAQRSGWRLLRGDESVRVDHAAKLRVNNSFAVRDAILTSLGIGLLPLLVAREAVQGGRMVPLLLEWAPAPIPVHAVYPSNRYLTPKVRAFIDLALQRFPNLDSRADWRIASNPHCAPDVAGP